MNGPSNFNSIKVRLELASSDIRMDSATSFQFHKGAIRTSITFRSEEACRIFQFHKGAIRTLKEAVRLAPCLNFNSIKVRLEHTTLRIRRTVTANFNSIKVRLEPLPDRCSHNANIFQFHKGAIRTNYRCA